MTSNEQRATTLIRALRAGIDRDNQTLHDLLTDDVRAWSPALSTSSLDELIDELDRRDEAFSDVDFDGAPLDVGGDHACVEWTVEMTHSGTITLTNDTNIDASGIRVTLHGVTIAEFVGERICSAAPVLGRAHRARATRRPHTRRLARCRSHRLDLSRTGRRHSSRHDDSKANSFSSATRDRRRPTQHDPARRNSSRPMPAGERPAVVPRPPSSRVSPSSCACGCVRSAPSRPKPSAALGKDFHEAVAERRKEADEFYAELTPGDASPDRALVMRQAFSGMLWSNSCEHVSRWWTVTRPSPPAGVRLGRLAGNFEAFDICRCRQVGVPCCGSTSTGSRPPSTTNRPSPTTAMFGGNSNWRGPLWLPLNFLVVNALERYYRFFGDDCR